MMEFYVIFQSPFDNIGDRSVTFMALNTHDAQAIVKTYLIFPMIHGWKYRIYINPTYAVKFYVSEQGAFISTGGFNSDEFLFTMAAYDCKLKTYHLVAMLAHWDGLLNDKGQLTFI